MSAVTKNDIQLAARSEFKDNNYWGLQAIATGVGKSKIGVDEAAEVVKINPFSTVVIVVPTKKLRDNNWLEEFEKWEQRKIYDENVSRYCYISASKVNIGVIDLLILDEGHNITELSSEIFRNNTVKRCLVLTATPPDPQNETDKDKIQILARLGLETIFEYSLDQAVADGLVAPYEINVVECTLDNTTKYIKAGTKLKPFYQTEKARYDYISKIIRAMQITGNDAVKWKTLERMRFIYNLRSKLEVAKRIIAKHVPPDERYLYFCGSIEQAEAVCNDTYHSMTTDVALEAFKQLKINKLSVVEALNEGHNIEGMDGAVIIQLSSNKRDLVQRLGRLIRIRPGHLAKIWILVVIDTVDENWFKKAIEPLDRAKIVYHHWKNVI